MAEGRNLSEQMEMMVCSVVRHGSEKEDRRKRKEEGERAPERGSHIIEFAVRISDPLPGWPGPQSRPRPSRHID